ncbi:MAG: hypothetical protein KGL63_01755 [Betaproteobacteria bacterium]|nr:hypothetical protein [Betaproteobacteria bacterium]
MKTTRRGFFKLVAGAALVPVAARVAKTLPTPILYGDGVHNDTIALQTLVDGGVVEFADARMAQNAGWFGNVLRLPAGTFKIDTTLMFGRDDQKWIGRTVDGKGSKIIAGAPMQYVLSVQDATDCTFTNLWIETQGCERAVLLS